MALVVADAGAVKSSKVALALESLQEAMKEEVSFAKPWHSLCSSKVRWSQPNVEELALHFIRSVPQDALLMLVTGSLKPGPLLTICDFGPLTVLDLAAGAPWVRPFAMKFPEAVPSAFLIADVLLYSDKILCGKLLRNRIESGFRAMGRLRNKDRTPWSKWLRFPSVLYDIRRASFFECCGLGPRAYGQTSSMGVRVFILNRAPTRLFYTSPEPFCVFGKTARRV